MYSAWMTKFQPIGSQTIRAQTTLWFNVWLAHKVSILIPLICCVKNTANAENYS
jgi:hypothetical protein